MIAERDEASGRDAADRIQQAGGQALFRPHRCGRRSRAGADGGRSGRGLRRDPHPGQQRGDLHPPRDRRDPEEWRQMLDVNVMGPALVAKHVVPAIRQAGGGAIVNLGSISSFIAQPNFVTYNTTKAAILGMTRCMAMDLAADNIRVNSVCPGVVWTQIVERQAQAMGLDRAAADVHPQWAGAS